MSVQPSLFDQPITKPKLRKVQHKTYLEWLKKLTGRDFSSTDKTHLKYASIEAAAGEIPHLIAKGFEQHGRCPECGWFGGHCSHTAVLGADGRYHT